MEAEIGRPLRHGRLVRRINDLKLRDKIILSYILFMIVPLLVVGFIVVNEFRMSTLTRTLELTAANVRNIKQETEEMLRVPVEISNRLSVDTTFEDIANHRYVSTYDVVRTYWDFGTLGLYTDFNSEVSRIKLYVDNPTLIDNWQFIPLESDTLGKFWYVEAVTSPQRLIGWFFFEDLTRRTNSKLSLVRAIYFPEYRTTGMLVVDVNTESLDASLGREPFDTLITDSRGTVIASSIPELAGTPVAAGPYKDLSNLTEPGAFDTRIQGKEVRVFVDFVRPEKSFNDLRIVSVVSLEDIISEANAISTTGFLILLAVFLVALSFIYFFYTMFSKRLTKLSRQIDRVGLGNFNGTLFIDGKDEIGEISHQFNLMVRSIKRLMEEVRSAREQKALLELKQSEMKLRMLASQINPHFLFNVLESIRMKAHINGEQSIARTVKLLGKLMRTNLETDGGPITVGEEIDTVRNYLDIARFRLEERLVYNLSVMPEAENLRIPPLIIQPLVENSLVHGVQNMQGTGTVTIDVSVAADLLEIRVEDNGLGMDAVRLAGIKAGLTEDQSRHIGLSNIYQRLDLIYRGAFGLDITSIPGAGTRVEIKIPAGVRT